MEQRKAPELRFRKNDGTEFLAWRVAPLSSWCELITKQTGFDYSKTIKPSLVTSKTPEDIPFIQNKDFEGRNINLDTDFFIPLHIANRFPHILLDRKCLLVSISGRIGNVGYYDKHTLAFIGGAVGICRLKQDANGLFLLYYLLSTPGNEQIQKCIKASSHQNITVEDIRKLKIPLPDTFEQRKISNFFSSIDRRIALADKKLTTIQTIKRGMLQKIFSQELRFKDDNGNEFPAWELTKLGDVAEVIGGGTPKSDEPAYWDGDVEWFTPSEIGAKYLSKSIRKISDDGLKNSSAKPLPKGTILLTSRASIGLCSINNSEKIVTTNQGFQSLVCKSSANNEFIYYWLQTKQTQRELHFRACGSTFLEISASEIKKLKLLLPSLSEQKKIAEYFTALDRSIDAAQKKADVLRTIKKGLLQKMFI